MGGLAAQSPFFKHLWSPGIDSKDESVPLSRFWNWVSVPILELSIACGWGGRGGGRGREILGAKWTVRPTPRDLWLRLPHFLQIILSLPPPPQSYCSNVYKACPKRCKFTLYKKRLSEYVPKWRAMTQNLFWLVYCNTIHSKIRRGQLMYE